MKTLRGCMENEKKNIYIIIAAAFCVILSANIYSSVKSYKYRRLCSEYREQLIATENANREFADRIGRITEITRRIKETADANITDARGVIETVEELRNKIKELEDCCGSFNYNDYYEYWDNEFHNEGLMD